MPRDGGGNVTVPEEWRGLELLMGELDKAAKALLREVPEDLAGLALPGAVVRAVRAADTTLPAFSLTMDKLLRVEMRDDPEPLMLQCTSRLGGGDLSQAGQAQRRLRADRAR